MEQNIPKRLNKLDFALLMVLALSVLGFWLAHAGHAGVDKIIEGRNKVGIDVYIAGLKTEDLDIFKVGDKSSITIRNQPVQPPMTISKVEHSPKQTAFLTPDGKKVVCFDDPTCPISHDYLVTVVDEAERTADGYVVRGNKIKLGNQIELEGFKYRVQGLVVDIKPVP
ncbi:MAG: hypothetical protein C5B53_09220 [Candidatus Melainabacteria bacterium]|nr:MAG: hypothetical protein C5B53_09220 [Candidatus Melainabacteria bacterium]